MSADFQKLQRAQPIHKSVQDAIRQYIVDRRLRPGDPMATEVDLARQLGVSRNSVREAVKSLASVGVLESRHGSGLFVREFSWDPLLDNLAYDLMQDIRSLAELLEVRRVLELGMLERALRNLTPAQVRDLEGVLDGMRLRSMNGEVFPEEDRAFHRILFRELQNVTFMKLLDIFWLAFTKASVNAELLDRDPVSTFEAHRRIYDTVVARDLPAATRALEQHYRAVTDRLQSQLGSSRSPEVAPAVPKQESTQPDDESKE